MTKVDSDNADGLDFLTLLGTIAVVVGVGFVVVPGANWIYHNLPQLSGAREWIANAGIWYYGLDGLLRFVVFGSVLAITGIALILITTAISMRRHRDGKRDKSNWGMD